MVKIRTKIVNIYVFKKKSLLNNIDFVIINMIYSNISIKMVLYLKKVFRILRPFSEVFVQSFSLKHLDDKYKSQYYEEANRSIIKKNIKRIFPLSVIIGLFQIIILSLYIFNDSYDSIGILKYINIGSGLFLLISCIFLGSFSYKIIIKNTSNYNLMSWTCRIFYFLIALGMLLFIYTDVKRGNFSDTIFYMAIIFSIVPVFSKKEALFFMFFNITGIIGIVFFIGNGSFLDNIQVIMILIASCIVMFYLRANTYQVLYHQLNLNYLNNQLEVLSKIDPLTGLPNRRYLDEYVNNKLLEWKKNASKIMVLMVDIDNFKNYNDTFSHLDGDDCLNAVTKCLTRTFSKTENITGFVSRIGGEEFMVLIEDWQSKEEALSICMKMKNTVENMHLIAGKGSLHEFVTISIGCSIYNAGNNKVPGGNPMEAQYRISDYELYNAKKKGKNRISYEGRIIE